MNVLRPPCIRIWIFPAYKCMPRTLKSINDSKKWIVIVIVLGHRVRGKDLQVNLETLKVTLVHSFQGTQLILQPLHPHSSRGRDTINLLTPDQVKVRASSLQYQGDSSERRPPVPRCDQCIRNILGSVIRAHMHVVLGGILVILCVVV